MFRTPTLTTDVIVENNNKILFIRRLSEPFKGMLALPGGRAEENETIEETAIREMKEETSLNVELKEILGVYTDPKRDPRGGISVVFIAKPKNFSVKAGSDARSPEWIDIKQIPFDKLAFDHSKIIKDYLKWKKNKGTYWSTKGP